MKSENWVKVFVGVILSVGAFLGYNLFEMKGTLSSVKTEVEATNTRVSRIADSLPEIKVRVAWEEVNHAIDGFIAVLKPKIAKGDRWITRAAVYQRDTEKLKVYSVSLDESHKDLVAYVIAGKIRAEGPYEASFSELASYSATLKEPVVLPDKLDGDTSFIFRSTDVVKVDKFLETIAEKHPRILEAGKIRNWKELSGKLEEIVETKEPKKSMHPTP